MSRIQRLTWCAAIGALSCLVVITVFAEDPAEVDLFGDAEPAAEAKTVAARATKGSEETVAAKSEAPARTSADNTTHRFNFCHCAGQGSPVAIARIEHTLSGPLGSNGMDFTETPLEEVVNWLQDEYGIPVKIKETALEASGIDPSEPVTVQLHNISLRSALRLMLQKLGLTYTVHDEVLEITTPEDANSHLVACVYNVRPCIGDMSPESMTELIDTITSCVRTETWAKNDKRQLAAIRSLKPGLLVISQTQHAHDEIASLLNAIQKMREKLAAQSDTAAD